MFPVSSSPPPPSIPRKETEKQVPRSHDKRRQQIRSTMIGCTFIIALFWTLAFRWDLGALFFIGLLTLAIGTITLMFTPKLVWKDITTDLLTDYQFDYLKSEDQETYREARHNEGNDTIGSNGIRSEDGGSTTS